MTCPVSEAMARNPRTCRPTDATDIGDTRAAICRASSRRVAAA
jgi:hypothetical protein